MSLGESHAWHPWGPLPAGRFDDAELARLARYTCIEELGTVTPELIEPESHDLAARGPVHLLERLYERLRAWNRPYNLEPWSPTLGQRIRDPEWIGRDSGTCLDLALAFASCCAWHRLPSLVVLLLPRDSLAGHALVACQIGEKWSPEDLGLRPSSQYAGVWRRSSGAPSSGRVLLHGYALIDPALATRFYVRSFAQNRADAVAQFVDSSFDDVAAVDLAAVLEARPGWAWGRPSEDARPAIGRRLPAMGEFRQTRSRRDDLQRLLGCRGVVVLAGASGVGKSRLALHVAATRDGNCGWFVPAHDVPTLISSLALRELQETGGNGALLSRVDREAFARSALQRLAGSGAPWAAVFDNAGAPTSDLLRWLPEADRRIGQLVVVTTTDEFAERWAEQGFEVQHLDPLTGDDIGELIDDLPVDLIASLGGNWLFLQALQRFQRATRRWPAAVPGGTPCARWLWEAVRDLPDLPAGVEEAALAMAVLSPTAVAHELSVALGSVPAAMERLTALGVVQRDESTGALSMHQLFADEIRAASAPTAIGAAIAGILTSQRAVAILRQDTVGETRRYLGTRVAILAEDLGIEAAGLAYHGLAQIEELHGDTRRSGELFGEAEALLDSLVHPREVADALYGQARVVNQHRTKDLGAIRRALGQVAQAEDLYRQVLTSTGGGADWELQAAPSRCLAMTGLLRHKEAGHVQDRARRLALLEAALDLVQQADDERQHILEVGTPESAFDRLMERCRSTFNFGGPRIELAKVHDHAETVVRQLDQAEATYAEVRRLRTEELGLRPGHPHVAACEHGLGLVAYYRAVLIRGASLPERVEQLRRAAAHSATALAQRTQSDGVLDRDEGTKSLALEVKIALARHSVAEWDPEVSPATRRERSTMGLLAGAEGEIRRAGWEPTWHAAPAGGVPFLPFEFGLEGLVAGVTTRIGGVSDGPYRSLNLGYHVGDWDEAVAENRGRVCRLVGVDELTVADQQHGREVAVVDEGLAGAGHGSEADAKERLGGVDAMVTGLEGVALTVMVADCAPVVLFDANRRVLAVAHVGRRGVVLDVIGAVVAAMAMAFGSDPADLCAGVGPCIGDDRYEIAGDALAETLAVFGDRLLTPTRPGHARFDLRGAVAQRLDEVGIRPERVLGIDSDTAANPSLFFSDRVRRPCGRFMLVARFG